MNKPTFVYVTYISTMPMNLVGKVVERTLPERLVVTWASPSEADIEAKHSRVTFVIQPFMEAVRLTVKHEELEPDSAMLHGQSGLAGRSLQPEDFARDWATTADAEPTMGRSAHYM